VVAANQPVIAPGSAPFLGVDFDYGYRSEAIRTEIEAQIESGDPFTVEDMNRIQLNDVNPYAQMLVPALLDLDVEDQFTRDAVALLEDWDMRNDPDSAAAAYFAAVWTNVLRLTFWDELPAGYRPDDDSRWLEAVRGLVADPENSWWDDRATLTVVEQRDEVLARALTDARAQLTVLLGRSPQGWSWGDLHQASPQHPVLGGEGVPGLVRTVVNRGPLPVGGGSSIVNATAWDPSSWNGVFPDFAVTTLPSMRMVLDLGDLDSSTWVQLTGSSGHPLSPHYDDQFRAWAAGETFSWPFSRAAVDEAGTDVLTLSPPG
jgi:penicillin G amidase